MGIFLRPALSRPVFFHCALIKGRWQGRDTVLSIHGIVDSYRDGNQQRLTIWDLHTILPDLCGLSEKLTIVWV